MKNRLIVLGSGTCDLVPGKAAASVLIETGTTRLVYDFGRGVSTRLTELGLKQDDVSHIFLSHLHPDHVTDILPYLHAASWSQIDSRTKDIHFYGAPGTEKFIRKMLGVFDWKRQLSQGFNIVFHDVTDEKLEIEGQRFKLVDLHHSHGLRFMEYAIAGDANLISDNLIVLLKGAKIGVFDSGHITDEEIVELAIKTQARMLVCSHQYRFLDEAQLNERAKTQGFEGMLVVARDLMEFGL